MPRPKGIPKTGGRKPGTPNKNKAALAEIIDGIIPPEERMLLAAKKAREGDLGALRFLEEYSTGKPAQHLEHSGSVEVTSGEIRKLIGEIFGGSEAVDAPVSGQVDSGPEQIQDGS